MTPPPLITEDSNDEPAEDDGLGIPEPVDIPADAVEDDPTPDSDDGSDPHLLTEEHA